MADYVPEFVKAVAVKRGWAYTVPGRLDLMIDEHAVGNVSYLPDLNKLDPAHVGEWYAVKGNLQWVRQKPQPNETQPHWVYLYDWDVWTPLPGIKMIVDTGTGRGLNIRSSPKTAPDNFLVAIPEGALVQVIDIIPSVTVTWVEILFEIASPTKHRYVAESFLGKPYLRKV